MAHVPSLTHYGEPYDGSTRFFRPTLFVAATRAACGEACLLHGTERLAPKVSAMPRVAALVCGWVKLAT